MSEAITVEMLKQAVAAMRRLFIEAADDEPMPSFEQLARVALEAALNK